MKFADRTVVEALEPYVDEILEITAELTCQPGIRSALVSDKSMINDFLEFELTGEKKFNKKLKKIVETLTHNTRKNREIIAELNNRLGVPVELHDYIYEIALRLRDR